MSKGDTTVHVDFEVGGASAAKMTVMDIYRAQQANASKVNEAARALSKEQQITFSEAKKALREWVRMQAQAANEVAGSQGKAEATASAEEAKREKARLSLAAQKSRALEAQFTEADRLRKRHADRAIQDAKRVANEELREAKRVANQKKRDLELQERQKGAFNKLSGRVAWGAAMGVAGYAGVAGVSNIFSGLSQGAQEFIAKRRELEDAIAPIVMLEDNVSNMTKIRQEVSSTAVALGRTYSEVGQFYSELIGTTGNLSSGERDQLVNETKELAQLTGGSLVTAQNLLTKSYQIYGKELTNVNQLQNKLMMTQDQASITFEEMGQRLPEVLQAGQLAGVSLDDVLATTIGATRRSGSIEKTMTGQRNFYLILEEAQKKGITLTGSYTEKVQQLANMFATNKDKMMGLFDREVVIHAKGITDAIMEITKASKELGSVTGETDAVFDKLLKKGSEPGSRQAQTFKSYEASIADAANFAPDVTADTPTLKVLEQFKAGQLAYDVATGGMLPDGWNAFAGGVASTLVPGFAAEGREMMINKQAMPDFINSKRVDFFRKKEADMEYLDAATRNGEWHKTPENIAKREEIENRQLSPHLMSEEERRIYKETGKGPTSAEITTATSAAVAGGATGPAASGPSGEISDTKTHALLKEVSDKLSMLIPPSGGASSQVVKPGGGTTNATE